MYNMRARVSSSRRALSAHMKRARFVHSRAYGPSSARPYMLARAYIGQKACLVTENRDRQVAIGGITMLRGQRRGRTAHASSGEPHSLLLYVPARQHARGL